MRRLFPLLVLALSASAAASPGKVKKARKLWAAYEGGEKSALGEALEVLEPALAHKKVAEDPSAHALMGHLQLEVARSERSLEGLSATGASLRKVLGMSPDDAVRADALDDLKAVQGLLLAGVEDDLAGKRLDAAWAKLEALVSVRALLAENKVVLRGMEERLLRTAIIVSAQSDHLDAALEHHEAFFGEGWFDAGLASRIATGLAAADRAEEALAFLAPLREEFPGDARLLRAQVELYGDDNEAAVGAVDAAKERLWPSVSGALLLADLYRDLAAGDAALEAYRQVLTLDERHRDALVRSAVIQGARADAAQAKLDEGGLPWREKRDLRKQVATDRADAVTSLEKARELDGRDREALERLVEAYTAHGDDKAAAEAKSALDALEAE